MVDFVKKQSATAKRQTGRIVVSEGVHHKEGIVTTRPQQRIHEGANTIDRIVNGSTK